MLIIFFLHYSLKHQHVDKMSTDQEVPVKTKMKLLTLPNVSFYKQSILLNMFWAQFHIPPPICVCGLCHWPMHNCQKSFGWWYWKKDWLLINGNFKISNYIFVWIGVAYYTAGQKKYRPKKLVKSNKSISWIIFFAKFNLLQFQKWPKTATSRLDTCGQKSKCFSLL